MKTLSALLLLSSLTFAQAPARYRIDAFAGTSAIGDGGPATSAILDEVESVLADGQGGFYLAGLFRIRYVSPDGNIRTVLGLGYGDEPKDGVPAVENTINAVPDMKIGPNGDLYVTDDFSCVVFRIDAAGIVRFVAGTTECGFAGDRGPARQAKLNEPIGLAFDTQGRLLIADQSNGRIRRIDLAGNIETIAGVGPEQVFSQPGLPATQTPVSFPTSITVAADGTIYFTEFGYRRVRRINPDGIVANVAGTGFPGNFGDGGPALEARFGFADKIALDAPRQRLYISDSRNNRVRAVDLRSGLISNVAGVPFGSDLPFADAFWGDGGSASASALARPRGISVDAAGALYIADGRNFRIRKVDTSSIIRTVAGRFRNTENGPALRAEFNNVLALALDPDGNLVMTDRSNRVIRRVSRGNIAVIAGTPPARWPANLPLSSSGDGGSALNARFIAPRYMAIDATGRIFVNDEGRLRKIDNGIISQVMNAPDGATTMAIDAPRNLLYAVIPTAHKVVVADITLATPVFRDFAGNGVSGFSGDGGNATAARLRSPSDVAIDAAGNVYVADAGNGRVRTVTAGVIATVIGNGNGVSASAVQADVAPLLDAVFPLSLTVDRNNRVTMVDGAYGVVRQYDPASDRLRVIAGTIGQFGLAGDGGLATGAQFHYLGLIRGDSAGNLYLCDGITSHVRILQPVTLSRFEAVSGGGQSAPAGTRLSAPLVVRVATADGPLSGVGIRFSATGAAFNPPVALTGADGTARTEVTLGTTVGPVTITAALEGLTPVTFQATATTAVVVNPNRPAIRSGGVATASAFGGLATISPGTWIEIFGTNLASATRPWGGDDFRGAQAPTELDGVKVSVNGQAAFVAFISPTQINAQVPTGIGTGAVPITVTNTNGTSDSVMLTAAAASPALLAPPVFAIGGVQYVVALHQDGAFVGRAGLIAGANFRPARPGDVLTLYGVGFGATTPVVAPGVVVSGTPALPAVAIRFGDASASVLFAGLAPSAVGLYQFNIVVPAGVPAGDVPLTVSGVGQRLVITVAR